MRCPSFKRRRIREQDAVQRRRITRALRRIRALRDPPYLRDFLRAQLDLGRVQILMQPLHHHTRQHTPRGYRRRKTYGDVSRPGNGYDVLALREEPRECNLAGRRAVRRADAREPVGELEDVREILFGVPWDLTPEVVLIKILWAPLYRILVSPCARRRREKSAYVFSGQEPAP